jgi:hypothetical protein
VGFQNLVFAWASAFQLAEDPLPQRLVQGVVNGVGAQTDWPVDDAAVTTRDGNVLVIQAKVGLNLGSASDSALAKAIHQAVEMFLSGVVPVAKAGGRPYDPARDAIVICTDGSARGTITRDLATAVRRIASHPPGTALSADLTSKQATAFKICHEHIMRSWTALAGDSPSDEDLRHFLKSVHVLTLHLQPDGEHREAALNVLERCLVEPSKKLSAWMVLTNEAQQASQTRTWRYRKDVVLALAEARILVRPPERLSQDIRVLTDRSATNLSKTRAEASLPVGAGREIHIPRSVAEVLVTDERRDPILVVGDAGAGKSAVVHELALNRSAQEDVVLLRASDVAGTNRLQTREPIEQVLLAWPGAPALLVIDGVDALRGSEDRQSLSELVEALAETRWQVVASARTFDTRNSLPLRRAFAGHPVSSDPAMFNPQLANVRHLLVGDLSEGDLVEQIVPPMPLADLLATASSNLRALLLNPFNLRLAAELSEDITVEERASLLQVRSRVELLHRYWEHRVRGADQYRRTALLRRLVAAMVTSRRLDVPIEEPTVRGEDSAPLETLLNRGVLAVNDGPVPGVGGTVAFSHNILFDYATAVHFLYSGYDTPSTLIGLLDDDPSLPLVARPALDFLIDMLWQARATGGFWPTALALSAPRYDLASMTVASRIVRLAHLPDDLVPLGPGPDEDASDGPEPDPKQRLTSHLIGAMRVTSLLPDPLRMVVPAVVLAENLVAGSAVSYRNVALAADLIIAMQQRVPADAGDPVETRKAERGAVVASLLQACRSMPQRTEHVASVLVRQCEHLIADSPELRQALRAVLDDSVTVAQWGGSVLAWLPELVLPVLDHDPQLARRLATEPLIFVETRDETVLLGGSAVLPLHVSRRDNAEMAGHQLVEVFPRVCAKDPVTGALILCDLARHREDSFSDFLLNDGAAGSDELAASDSMEPSECPQQPRLGDAKTDLQLRDESGDATVPDPVVWPVEAHEQTGWLEPGYGLGLSEYEHEDEQKMFTALARLLTSKPQAAADVVRTFVANLHEGWAWAALMQDPASPSELARALFPAFRTGTLLAHPDTSTYAARLLAAAVHTSTVPHADAEAVILAAIDLVERHALGDFYGDVLVGCLDPDQLTDPALVDRRQRLGDDPPQIPHPHRIGTTVTPYRTVDHVRRQGIDVASEAEGAALALQEALQRADDKTQNADAAIDALTASFSHAAVVFASSEVPTDYRSLLVRAAHRLTAADAVTPPSTTGRLVFGVLTDAWRSDDAGTFLR